MSVLVELTPSINEHSPDASAEVQHISEQTYIQQLVEDPAQGYKHLTDTLHVQRRIATLLLLGTFAGVAAGCTPTAESTATPVGLQPTTIHVKERPKPTPTIIHTPIPTPSVEPTNTQPTTETVPNQPTETRFAFIKSVSTMNQSKDRLREPLSLTEKKKLIDQLKALGITHIGNETPLDAPEGSGLDAEREAREWIQSIHDAGLGVIHRHASVYEEGMYQEDKPLEKRIRPELDFIKRMQDWMKKNKDLIAPQDLWMPVFIEAGARGIVGQGCPNENQPVCIFTSVGDFNQKMQDAVTASRATLDELGLYDTRVICCSDNGYQIWGDNNPDSIGKSLITPETMKVIQQNNGLLALDLNPQVNTFGPRKGQRATYAEDLAEFQEKWPGVRFMLAEFGPNEDPQAEPLADTFDAFAHIQGLAGVQYFQARPTTGAEYILNDDFSPNNRYREIQKGLARLPQQVIFDSEQKARQPSDQERRNEMYFKRQPWRNF